MSVTPPTPTPSTAPSTPPSTPPSTAPSTQVAEGFAHDLESRARSAYERRRLVNALPVTLPVLLTMGVAYGLGTALLQVAVLGTLAAAAVVFFLWRGQELGDGVAVGIAIGALPTLAVATQPFVIGVGEGALCAQVCFSTTLIGGCMLGALLGRKLNRSGGGKSILASFVVAGLLAPLGCLGMSVGGTVGLLLGLLLGSVPGYVLTRHEA